MQLHDILLLCTSEILPEAILAGGLTPTTDTSLFLTTYRGGSHLPADIFCIIRKSSFFSTKNATDILISCGIYYNKDKNEAQ